MIAHRQRERAPCPLYIEGERMVFGASRGVFFDFFVCFPSRKVSVVPTPSLAVLAPSSLSGMPFDPHRTPFGSNCLICLADHDDPPVNSCTRFHPIIFCLGNDVFVVFLSFFFCYCSLILMDRLGFLWIWWYLASFWCMFGDFGRSLRFWESGCSFDVFNLDLLGSICYFFDSGGASWFLCLEANWCVSFPLRRLGWVLVCCLVCWLDWGGFLRFFLVNFKLRLLIFAETYWLVF